MKNRINTRQSGFTLVEIAIVLVIIGLLLGGVLKGQEMIDNSRVKAVANEMKGVQTAFHSYVDRYKGLPGDENNIATRNARGWPATGLTGDRNGQLLIATGNTFNGTLEAGAMWAALRSAGLLTGNPIAAAAERTPRSSVGGFIGVTSPGTTVFGMPGAQFVCASGLTTKQAAALDTLIDGPLPATQIGNNSGSLQGAMAPAGTPATAPNAAALIIPGAPPPVVYNETAQTGLWTMCYAMG